MNDIKETILSDAIQVAIEETRENKRLRRIVIVESILLIVLSIIVITGGI